MTMIFVAISTWLTFCSRERTQASQLSRSFSWGELLSQSISRVSTFEASAERSLLICGADIVFIGSNRKGDLRISARAKPHILGMGIHLGEFMSRIGAETGNQGGGHDGAAGINGKGNVDQVLSICMSRMSDILREKIYDPSK